MRTKKANILAVLQALQCALGHPPRPHKVTQRPPAWHQLALSSSVLHDTTNIGCGDDIRLQPAAIKMAPSWQRSRSSGFSQPCGAPGRPPTRGLAAAADAKKTVSGWGRRGRHPLAAAGGGAGAACTQGCLQLVLVLVEGRLQGTRGGRGRQPASGGGGGKEGCTADTGKQEGGQESRRSTQAAASRLHSQARASGPCACGC